MSYERLKLLAAAVGGGALVFVTLLGLGFVSADVERQTDVQFVNMAIEILADEPTQENQPLRAWAIDIINEHSSAQISGPVKDALFHNAWSVTPTNYLFMSDTELNLRLKEHGALRTPASPDDVPTQPSE